MAYIIQTKTRGNKWENRLSKTGYNPVQGMTTEQIKNFLRKKYPEHIPGYFQIFLVDHDPYTRKLKNFYFFAGVVR